MSSTRYAEHGSPLAQHRYASAEEYAEQRGIQGTAVAAKASLYRDERKRTLLFSLQALSLKEGGFRQFAKEFLPMFPDRIEPGVGSVERSLPDFLTSLCVDPKIQIVLPGENEDQIDQERDYACVQDDSINMLDWREARLSGFKNIIGALLEFFQRRQKTVWADFVVTSIGKQVVEKLKYAARTRTMITIEADAGRGKTEATKVFCEANPGAAVMVSLTGNADKTTFFRLISRARGLPATAAMNCNKMRLRVEDFFQRSKLMLVIDEAHHLWPPGKRTCRNPELIDWIDTALCNYGVPVVLVATKEFSRRRGRVEEVSGWNSEQFRRRNRRHVIIDDLPTREDLVAVARKLLPEATNTTVERLLDYAQSTGGYFQALVDTVSDARLLAEDAGRSNVIERDIKRALKEFRLPSDANQKRHTPETANRRGSKARPFSGPEQAPFTARESSPPDEPTLETNRMAAADLTPA